MEKVAVNEEKTKKHDEEEDNEEAEDRKEPTKTMVHSSSEPKRAHS